MTLLPPLRLVSIPALALLLCHCDDGSAARIKGLREEINQMNQESYDASQQVKRLQSQIEGVKAEKQKLEEEKAKVEQERTEAQKKLEQLQRDFDTYKSSYKLSMQKRAPGMKIGDFTTIEGKAFRNITLRELTDSYVNFSHEAGIIKLTAAQLPEPVQALLGFLNSRTDQPREVMTLTARQSNMKLKAEYGDRLDAMDDKIKALRHEKDLMQREIAVIKSRIREMEYQGQTGTTALKRQVEQIELRVKKLETEIMQAEVERHGIRSKSPVLRPE